MTYRAFNAGFNVFFFHYSPYSLTTADRPKLAVCKWLHIEMRGAIGNLTVESFAYITNVTHITVSYLARGPLSSRSCVRHESVVLPMRKHMNVRTKLEWKRWRYGQKRQS